MTDPRRAPRLYSDPLWRRTVYRRASLADLLTRAADALDAQCPRCGAAWHVDPELAAELRERADELDLRHDGARCRQSHGRADREQC